MKPLAIIHIGAITGPRPRLYFPLVLTLSGTTCVVYALVYQAMGPSVVALSIPPVVAVAWLFGLRAGLLTGVLFFALNAILLVLSEHPVTPWTAGSLRSVTKRRESCSVATFRSTGCE